MRRVAEVHPVPWDIVAAISRGSRETPDELLHEGARRDHVERLEAADAEVRDDVVAPAVLQRDLGVQLLDTPDLPAGRITHGAPEQIAQRHGAAAHLRSPDAPGMRP